MQLRLVLIVKQFSEEPFTVILVRILGWALICCVDNYGSDVITQRDTSTSPYLLIKKLV